MHHDFRLFSTANTQRIFSNKLSGALLNRVIRIYLPPLDWGLPASGATDAAVATVALPLPGFTLKRVPRLFPRANIFHSFCLH